MKVLDPGHKYELDNLDSELTPTSMLQFVKRLGDKYPGNEGHAHGGVNIQEVIRVIIDRVKYLDNQIPDVRNLIVLRDMRNSLWALECRAADRHSRLAYFVRYHELDVIETYPTCKKCGHIGCNGECHGH